MTTLGEARGVRDVRSAYDQPLAIRRYGQRPDDRLFAFRLGDKVRFRAEQPQGPHPSVPAGSTGEVISVKSRVLGRMRVRLDYDGREVNAHWRLLERLEVP